MVTISILKFVTKYFGKKYILNGLLSLLSFLPFRIFVVSINFGVLLVAPVIYSNKTNRG